MTGKRLARHPGRRLRRLSERCFYRPLVTTLFFFLLLAYLEFFAICFRGMALSGRCCSPCR